MPPSFLMKMPQQLNCTLAACLLVCFIALSDALVQANMSTDACGLDAVALSAALLACFWDLRFAAAA